MVVMNGKTYYDGTVVWDCINECELNFNLGNVVKYVCRAGKKERNSKQEDLWKALDYLVNEINKDVAYPIYIACEIDDEEEETGS